MSKDWMEWHREYERAGSSLARRLDVVRGCVHTALGLLTVTDLRVISVCAGTGRDVLPVLAERRRAARVLLVESDPGLAATACTEATARGLRDVTVARRDAGTSEAYEGIVPAHLVFACGVFGNISDADLRRTIATLPTLTAAGGIVIWTRGRNDEGGEPAQAIRAGLAENGFAELSFTAPTDAVFRVGMARLATGAAREFRPGQRMFTFVG